MYLKLKCSNIYLSISSCILLSSSSLSSSRNCFSISLRRMLDSMVVCSVMAKSSTILNSCSFSVVRVSPSRFFKYSSFQPFARASSLWIVRSRVSRAFSRKSTYREQIKNIQIVQAIMRNY